METDFAFSEPGRSPWIHTTAERQTASPLSSEGLSRRSWEEFMTFDTQTHSPTSHTSHAATSPTPHGLTSYLNQGSKPETSVPFDSANSTSFSLPPTGIPTLPVAFGQAPVNQGFQFSAPGLSGQISPFSEYSHQDGVEAWDGKSPTAPAESSRMGYQTATELSPTHPKAVTPPPSDGHSPRSAAESLKSRTSGSSPHSNSKDGQKKRKAFSDDDESAERSDKERPGAKKSAHNMIEKRYRNNLNDKIAALRDAVPSLRVMCRNASEGDDDEGEDLEGLAPAHKLNKATVLSKATEYIRHLQKQKTRQDHEMSQLRARVESYERMVKMGSFAYHPPAPTTYGDDMFARNTAVTAATQATQGMIPLPDNLARMRPSHIAGSPYTAAQNNYPAYPAEPPNGNIDRRRTAGPRGGNMARVMVGSFTTLMLIDGLWERQHGDNEVEDRGLFSIPFTVLGRLLSRSRSNPIATQVGFDILTTIRIVLLVVSLGYLLAPLINSKLHAKKRRTNLILRANYSLASPVELRRKAWLTAIQTVWVPRHNIILEAAALGLKTVKLSVRKLIGWDGYALLTGFTKDQETARVKAWSIALDAQLTGGDAEISLSRLILTVLASGTLPNTPARLMLNALHVKVLFWEAANAGYGAWLMLDELSSKLARSYWNAARAEFETSRHNNKASSDEWSLPDHLAAILELDSDDVLIDDIVERAYNLAWNKPRSDPRENDEAMNAVTEDIHIASPLDALAAWWSTFVLNRVLASSLQSQSGNDDDVSISHALELVLKTAPPPSVARIRALVARAVLVQRDREKHIRLAMDALPCPAEAGDDRWSSSPVLHPVNLVVDDPLPPDLLVALTLAKCRALAESTSYQSHLLLTSSVNKAFPLDSSFSLLSFTAYILLVDQLISSPDLLNDTRISLERLVTTLRIWIGSRAGSHSGIPSAVRSSAIDRCLGATKAVVGISDDEADVDLGYASQSDGSRQQMPKCVEFSSIAVTSIDGQTTEILEAT